MTSGFRRFKDKSAFAIIPGKVDHFEHLIYRYKYLLFPWIGGKIVYVCPKAGAYVEESPHPKVLCYRLIPGGRGELSEADSLPCMLRQQTHPVYPSVHRRWTVHSQEVHGLGHEEMQGMIVEIFPVIIPHSFVKIGINCVIGVNDNGNSILIPEAIRDFFA